jgi:hypothetical protein
MKVRLYKAPDGKGKLVKAKDGMAVNIDKEINKKIAEGKDPEIIIYEMAEFGLSRDQARDKVYKQYDLLGDDEYDEDEVSAPYDRPVQEETTEVVEEEEPDNAAIYDYYGGDNQGLDVVNEGADEDEDEDMARYGGQYAEGGQFAPGSIVPKPKQPYYIGMDAEPYDNAYKFGGLTKGAYVKKRIKELRKAAQGEEVKNNETNISPRGTIDSPSGFTPPEKNLAAIIKQTANEAKMKETAENEYQQYQESTMGDNFNGKFLFGGRNRKIARANRALFGTPIAMPGANVNYEFGPLGGLRKAEATWDLDAIGDLAKMLPGAMNMMPGMFPGMMGPGMMSYKKVSYPAQVRKKTISTINNAALDEVAKQNPNSTAAQNNKSSKKNEIKCPPGSVYDPNLGYCADQDGNRVRSIVDLPDPEELLGNPFENPNARMLNGKKTMKATGPSSSASSTAATQSTQASSVGGAPLQSEQALVSSLMNPVLNSQGQQLTSNASNMMYGQQGLPPVASSAPSAPMVEASEWKGVYDPATDSYIDDSSMLLEFMNNNPDLANDPEMEQLYINEMGYSSEDWNKAKNNFLSGKKEHGGFVDAANMDPNTLAKFIYGGDEYAYGGDVLHKAYDGYITNFQKQMNATKNRIDQMGSKKPEDLLGNPFKGNTFGKATTGIQPSGTVSNRFQPTGQPNTGTTTQGGVGTTGGGRGIMSQQRSEELSRMTPEQRKAEAEKGKKDFDNWFNNSVQQEYRQMMQGQQGNPFMGNAFGNQQFWTGRPQRLGFGLTRDFNYSNAFSPVNWQVPEGTKKIREVAYKDRGRLLNPFDNKRIREWYADPEDGAADDLINKQGSGKNIKAGTTSTNTGTTSTNAEDNTETTETRTAKGMKLGKDEMLMTNVDVEGNPMGIDSKGRLVNADAESITPPSSMPTRGASQIPSTLSGTAPETIQTAGQANVSSSNPFTGDAFGGNQFGSASSGVGPSGNLKFAQSPNNFTMSGQSNLSSNKFAGNAFGTASTGISGNMQNTNLEEEDVQSGIPYNTSGPLNEDMNQGMAYGGYMDFGGYVPEYMAYGGYMPEAKSGITVDKKEFSDPDNLLGRIEESAGYTADLGQLATDVFSGDSSLSGLAKNWKNAFTQEKNILDPARKMSRTSDTGTANTGQSGSERKGTDLMASGTYTQYGTTPGKQGYEGGLYGKKGGEMNSQYAKGKVYSLTMEQIKAIEAAGGKVEYIK